MIDGEHEYGYEAIVKARDEHSADRKARKQTAEFLLSPMEWTSDDTLEPVNGSEYRVIKYNGIVAEGERDVVKRLIESASWSLPYKSFI